MHRAGRGESKTEENRDIEIAEMLLMCIELSLKVSGDNKSGGLGERARSHKTLIVNSDRGRRRRGMRDNAACLRQKHFSLRILLSTATSTAQDATSCWNEQ